MMPKFVAPCKEERRMARSRSLATLALSLIFAAAPWQFARSQSEPPVTSSTNPRAQETQEPRSTASCEPTCAIYPLSGLGDDPKLARWVAETIPEVIEPGSWAENGGVGRIRCHASSKILIITHTPAVHVKVSTFLRDLRKAMVAEGPAAASNGRPVVQAQFTEPAAVKPVASGRNAYLVPPPVKQPKHLFHLIIRYEGDGLGDLQAEKVINQLTGNVPPAKDANDKACPDAGKSSLDQLLHVILRYEGEGIVDSNVVALVKELAGSGGIGPRCTPPQAVPAYQGPNAPLAEPSIPPPPASAPDLPPRSTVGPNSGSQPGGIGSPASGLGSQPSAAPALQPATGPTASPATGSTAAPRDLP
jgi:hypothetical protein